MRNMDKIAIITDSTSDLSGVLVAENKNLRVIPLKVNFQEETYTEGVDITNEEFYEKLEKAEVLPTTSQPSPGEFIALYEELLAEGYDSIISIHISDHMSGTRQSANIAGEKIKDKIKNFKTIDSKSVSSGAGALTIYALDVLKQENDFSKAIERIEKGRDNADLIALVDTLKYLEKGGRIGKASALLGSLLSVKPILTTEDGVIINKDKVRSRKRGLEYIVKYLIEKKATNEDLIVSLVHAQAEQEAMKLADRLDKELGIKVKNISEIGAVVGTHIGPGAILIGVA